MSRRLASVLRVVLLLAFCRVHFGETLLQTDFTDGVQGWENVVLANTSQGVLAYVKVATPLRHDCWRQPTNQWDKAMRCGAQGEDAGGFEVSQQNVAKQRIISPSAGITIRLADPTAVPLEKETWYFMSPPSWSRDISLAYDGYLLIQIQHRVIPARDRAPGRADVILTARCGFHLSHFLPIDEGLAGRVHKLRLTVEADWIDSRTGQAPSRQSFLGKCSKPCMQMSKLLQERTRSFVNAVTVDRQPVTLLPLLHAIGSSWHDHSPARPPARPTRTYTHSNQPPPTRRPQPPP